MDAALADTDDDETDEQARRRHCATLRRLQAMVMDRAEAAAATAADAAGDEKRQAAADATLFRAASLVRQLILCEARIIGGKPKAGKPSAIRKPDTRRDILRSVLYPIADKQPTSEGRTEFRQLLADAIEAEVEADPDVPASVILIDICQAHDIALDPAKVPDSVLITDAGYQVWKCRAADRRQSPDPG